MRSHAHVVSCPHTCLQSLSSLNMNPGTSRWQRSDLGPDSSTEPSPGPCDVPITCSKHSFLPWLLKYEDSEDPNPKFKGNAVTMPVLTSARIQPVAAGFHERLQVRICCGCWGKKERKNQQNKPSSLHICPAARLTLQKWKTVAQA